MPHLLLAESQELLFTTTVAGLQDGIGSNILSEIRIRNAHSGSFQNCRVTSKSRINLPGGNILSTFDNQFFHSSNDKEIAVLIPVAKVTRVQPAIRGENLGCCSGVFIITLHRGRATNDNFTLLACAEFT